MIRRLPRAIAAMVFGALAGAAALVLLYSLSPGLVLEMGPNRSRTLTGLYGGERFGELTFAWTAEQADVPFPGLDRSVAWRARVRLRGARSDAASLPEVTLLADGVPLVRDSTTNEFQTIEAIVPVRPPPARGLTLSVATSSVFVPGAGDSRMLGVQIDRIELEPERLGAFPPRRAVAAAMAASAIFGGIFGLLGATAGTAIAAATLLALAQAAVLRVGFGPFAGWIQVLPLLAGAIGVGLLATVVGAEQWRHGRLRNTARFALMFSASALYLKLLVLLHPDKDVLDAVVHVDRLGAVMSGGYLFTSLAPGGDELSYPVGLYIAALPFTAFTRDHVLLLRVIVAVGEAVSCVLLYWLLARAWGDRLVAATAVAVAQLMPLGLGMQAAAHFTSVFAQSSALVAMVLAATMVRNGRRWVPATAAAALVAALSHTSTFLSLAAVMTTASVLLVGLGRSAVRRHGGLLLATTALVVVLALPMYYGRVSEGVGSAFHPGHGEMTRAPYRASAASATQYQPGERSVLARLAAVPRDAARYYGWPFLVLSLAGLGLAGRRFGRDSTWLVFAGWLVACLCLLLASVVTPIDLHHYYAALPAMAVLAAVAAVAGWQHRRAWRAAAIALCVAGSAIAVHHWLGLLYGRVL